MEPENNRHITHVILLDVQGTCNENHDLKPCQETIELSVAVLCLQSLKILGQFHSYVKPKCNPKLTQFCRKYTHIQQEQVKEAPELDTVFHHLEQWVKKFNLKLKNSAWVTWGVWSIESCLKTEFKVKKMEFPHFMHCYINLKKIVQRVIKQTSDLKRTAEKLEVKASEAKTRGLQNIENLIGLSIQWRKKYGNCFTRKQVIPLVQILNCTITESLQYLLVLDFQATCEDNVKMQPCAEIIELPVMVVDLQKGEIIRKFHQYVQPSINPKLTPFCTELTGITQQMVQGQPPLKEVLQNLDDWVEEQEYLHSNNFTMVTCGDWDLCTCLKRQCKVKHLHQPSYLKNYINIKKVFTKAVPEYDRSMGMMGMLKALKIQHEGRHHSGIDDVLNICNICLALMKKGALFSRNNIIYVK